MKKILLKERKLSKKDIKSDNKLLNFAKITISVLVVIGVLAGGVYFGYNNSLESVENIYTEYEKAMEKKEYNNALEIYRNLYDDNAKNQIFNIHKERKTEILDKIESDISFKIEKIFNDLVNDDSYLGTLELEFFESFQEITIRILGGLFNDFLEMYLYGEYDLERAKNVVYEISKIDLNLSFLNMHENEIDNIGEFSPTMNEIIFLHKNNENLKTANLISESIENNSGYVKEYLAGYLLDLKDEMYPILMLEMETKINNHMYYTAKDVLTEMEKYYKDDIKLNELLEIANQNTTENLSYYYNPIEHISIRPLIADRNFNFDKDSYTRNADNLMITSDEFKSILEELYENDYILIDINMTIDEEGNRKYIQIPEGKKPIILSIEGLNYYVSRQKTGNSIKLSLDKNNNILSTYKDENGNYITDENAEAIGILNQFVNKNPSFSFDGAKGVISLTGYENIFGYIINQEQLNNTNLQYREIFDTSFSVSLDEINENKQTVKQIFNVLEETGWSFASSTYANFGVNGLSLEQLKTDTIKWKDLFYEYIGTTQVFLFPSGSSVYQGDERTRYLIEQGFLIHSGIGPTAYFYHNGEYLFMDRIAINGYTLRNVNLSRLFDKNKVYSPSRTIPIN